jgi:hypothetical protein
MKGKVMVNMIEYIKNIVTNFPEEINALKTSPVADHLFKLLEEFEAKPLLERQAMVFHHTTMQLLFLSVHARCDIQPTKLLFSRRM